MKPNFEIRNEINNSNFFTWELAKKLRVHENTFYRWMRTEMTEEKKEMVMAAIEELKREGGFSSGYKAYSEGRFK